MQYNISDFINSDNVYISSAAQNMPAYPLSLRDAQIFFQYFKYESFDFDGVAKTIDIRSAKYNLPRSSWADGYLYSQTLDELDVIADRCNQLPNSVGHIYFACGGHNESPLIRVEKETYLFWNDGKVQVPPCGQCGSLLTYEDQKLANGCYDIYVECMECKKRESQGKFSLRSVSFVKL